MNRYEALQELKIRIFDRDLIRHSLAVEAIMKGLASYFKEDEVKWGLAGLLHDIDYNEVATNNSEQSLVATKLLRDLKLDESIIYAIKAQKDNNKTPRQRKIDRALYSANLVSELIDATVLDNNTQKLENVNSDFLFKKINGESFGKGINMEGITNCTEMGMSLKKFLDISLNAVKRAPYDLDL